MGAGADDASEDANVLLLKAIAKQEQVLRSMQTAHGECTCFLARFACFYLHACLSVRHAHSLACCTRTKAQFTRACQTTSRSSRYSTT